MAVLTTGGTAVYTQSAIQIIKGALRSDLVINEEETPSGDMLESSMDTLNAMAKGWQANGIHVWCEEEGILFLNQGQNSYQLSVTSPDHATLYDTYVQNSLAVTALAGATTLSLQSAAGISNGDTIGVQLDAGTNFWTTVSAPPSGDNVAIANALPSQASALAVTFDYTLELGRPLRLYTGRRFTYEGQLEVPMITLSRTDWANLPNKQNQGVITQYFFDAGTGNNVYSTETARAYFWPTPDSDAYGFRYTAQRPIQDFVTLANIPDFPAEWLAALRWNLALELAPEWGTPADHVDRQIRPLAEKWLSIVSQWDREPQSVLFGVAFQPGYHNG